MVTLEQVDRRCKVDRIDANGIARLAQILFVCGYVVALQCGDDLVGLPLVEAAQQLLISTRGEHGA
ncbi:hypothetical protein VL15_37910 [Burkholderia cepacia]|uniref:Uncharacterized protein n=1 Tax=Burkholderia cepacia TaxID=292 RepID=A0A0J5YX41_BURCE|nr:hypothetical protein VL15_37910 [Burkholderia cepacia]